jgi:hypothetical protein
MVTAGFGRPARALSKDKHALSFMEIGETIDVKLPGLHMARLDLTTLVFVLAG